MHKKILVLFAQKSIDNRLCDPVELTKLLNEHTTVADVTFYWAMFEDLIFSVTNESLHIRDTRNQIDISEYHSINLRFWGEAQGHAMALARYCHETGITFVDTEALRVGSFNKLTQYVNLHYAGVPIPRTIMGHMAGLFDAYMSHGFGFPMIAKAAGGTRGQDNYMVHNAEELRVILDEHEAAFILQEFIPNEGDYRVLVTGDEVNFVLHRQSTIGSHLNNTSQGGLPTPVPIDQIDPQIVEIAVRASKYYGRDFGGVDIVQASDTGKYYCFEVNRSPQIEGTAYADQKARVLGNFLAAG